MPNTDLDVGRMLVLHKGTYNASTTYEFLDEVIYNGTTYRYINTTSGSGHTPTDTNYWQIVASKGNNGTDGEDGKGIVSIAKTGTSGLVDTYTITFTDGTTSTFTVTNGQDGQGSGDMTKAVYDSTNAVSNAGGIVDYVEDSTEGITQLIKDTVGWTNKNEIVYPYYDRNKSINGLTFTMLPDGGVKINGTATDNTAYNFTAYNGTSIVLNGKYKLLGNSEFGASRLKITVEAPVGVNWSNEGSTVIEKEFTNATVQNIRLWMYTGQVFDNVVVYPMLWDAKILDPTFEINYGTTAFPRSEQAVLGAKQWFDPTKITTTTKISITNDGKNIALENSDSTQYFSRFFYVDVLANMDFKLSADVAVTSGQAGFRVASEDGVTTIKEVAPINASASSEFTFNTGNRTRIRVVLFGTYETSSTCNVAYNNLLITLATDTDRTWAPFAMTNRALTDAVVKNHNLSFYYKELTNETTGVNSEIAVTLDAPVKFAMVVGNNMKVYYDNRAYEPFVSGYTSAGSSTVTLRFAKQGTQELMPQGTSVTVAIMFAVVYA